MDGDRPLIDVRMAAELTGEKPATVRAAVRRGDLELVATAPQAGPYGRAKWLLDAEAVVAWRRARCRARPVPSDPVLRALAGDLRVALDRDLGLEALGRVEAERVTLAAAARELAARAQDDLIDRLAQDEALAGRVAQVVLPELLHRVDAAAREALAGEREALARARRALLGAIMEGRRNGNGHPHHANGGGRVRA